jgi:DNA-binding MarR family transcriptional regulator
MSIRPFDVAVAEFAHALGLLVRRVRAAASPHDLSLSEASVMARLSREGPATIAELARAEGMKPQSMGTTVSTLEKAGMIEREPHATDGRQRNILLTAKGAAVRKRSKEAKRTWLAEAIARLDREEQATLFAAGEIIKRLAER